MRKRVDSNTARCSADYKTCVRPFIRNIKFAFSPFFNAAAFKHKHKQIPFQVSVRAAYLLGCKVQNDSAAHLCRLKQMSIRQSEKNIGMCYDKFKIALAYTETVRAEQEVFREDVVEPDTARTAGKRDDGNGRRGHHGRTLVLKGRFAKHWVVKALLPTQSRKGSRGMAPETKAEVAPFIQAKMGKGTVLAPDGGQAFAAVAAKSSKPILEGVRHGQKIFTPVARLMKKDLDKDTFNILQKHTKGKKPCVREYKAHFVICAGDQGAESAFAHIKNTMRRLGNIGRFKTQNATRKNIETLAAAALLRKPGVDTVLDALATYRHAGLDGSLQLSSKEAYNMEKLWWVCE